MSAQKGKDLLVKISDGAGGFTTVAGLRTRRLAFNAETVDVTNAESSNRWRELLDGAGVKRASLTGRGLFKDASSDALTRQTFFDGTIVAYQVVTRRCCGGAVHRPPGSAHSSENCSCVSSPPIATTVTSRPSHCRRCRRRPR